MLFATGEWTRLIPTSWSVFPDALRTFASKHVDSAQIDRDGAQSEELLAGLKALGLYGVAIPKEHGGSGMSTTAFTRVMQEIGSIDQSLNVTFAGHMSIGLKGIVLLEVSAVMPHGVILHRIDEGARAECFVLLAADTHPGYPLARHNALPKAATLPLFMHHQGGFWHIDQLTGKETALAPTPKQEKLSRIPAHTRFASDPYPEHWIVRSGAAHSPAAA